MTEFKKVSSLPKLHSTPLAKVTIETPRVVVQLDDEHEERMNLIFEPYQAVRVVTADCLSLPGGLSIIPKTVSEVIKSSWVDELRKAARLNDETSTFMERARHFFLPLQDFFVEIVAWEVRAQRTTDTELVE